MKNGARKPTPVKRSIGRKIELRSAWGNQITLALQDEDNIIHRYTAYSTNKLHFLFVPCSAAERYGHKNESETIVNNSDSDI